MMPGQPLQERLIRASYAAELADLLAQAGAGAWALGRDGSGNRVFAVPAAGRHVGRVGHQRPARRQQAGHRVDRADLKGSARFEARQIIGMRSASIVFHSRFKGRTGYRAMRSRCLFARIALPIAVGRLR